MNPYESITKPLAKLGDWYVKMVMGEDREGIFFQNKRCQHFPCHELTEGSLGRQENKVKKKFNCLFCFCPLYDYEDCGGVYTIEEDKKDCAGCKIPHFNYSYVIEKIEEHDKLFT